MLTRQKLAEINSRVASPAGRSPAVYAALGAFVGAVAAGVLVSPWLGCAVLLLGAAVALLLGRSGSRTQGVRLFYNLDAESEARFSAVRTACETLAGSEKVWRIDEDRGTADEAVATVGPRRPASVGTLKTPGFSANVEVWGIEAGELRLFFLPECVLLYENERYKPISYGSFGVAYGRSRRAEDGEVPSDAEVLGGADASGEETGRGRGGPDRPVVAYGQLEISGLPDGGTLCLLVSDRARAVRFARPFGVGREEARGDEARTAREARARRAARAEAGRNDPLFGVLGLEPGASEEEIHAAYKQKARMYHPDRVASLAPEVREMAELRMKEINAAYGELKRRKSPGAR